MLPLYNALTLLLIPKGIMRKSSFSGSSSGSQDRSSKGVTFATDYTRMVSVLSPDVSKSPCCAAHTAHDLPGRKCSKSCSLDI